LRTSRALGFALLTVFGIVLELFVVEEELLARGKDELGAAVYALEHTIGKFHGRLPQQGAPPESAMAPPNSPVAVPCFLSTCTSRARTARKKERLID
jgi:hypothetical protein